jgi:phage tail sheath protein FI
MYYPWIDILNQAGRRKRMPASGHIAGIYQRQSQQYGHHKPPANAQIYGAVNLEHELTDGEQAVLTPIGINVLRAFPGRGIRPWGARTLSSDGFYRYIHTRRMLSMIKSAINDGTSWVQFELHDPALLVRVHKQINDFLEMLRLKGVLVGDTPEEAYFVQCDEDLNPPQKQKQGELTAMIGIALLQPANFYQFYVRQANSARKMVAEINY